MTRRISFIVGIAVTALAVGVPTALGREGGPNTAIAEPSQVSTYRDAFERAAAQNQSSGQSVVGYRDAHERGVPSNSEPQWKTALRLRSEALNKQYGLGEFASSASERALLLRSEALNKQYGLGEFAAGSTQDVRADDLRPRIVSVTSSGTEVDWPQIGVGLGLGIVLAIGLGLLMRAVHHRPFAH